MNYDGGVRAGELTKAHIDTAFRFDLRMNQSGPVPHGTDPVMHGLPITAQGILREIHHDASDSVTLRFRWDDSVGDSVEVELHEDTLLFALAANVVI